MENFYAVLLFAVGLYFILLAGLGLIFVLVVKKKENQCQCIHCRSLRKIDERLDHERY